MKGKQHIRMILTALVLLIGGYFIQNSVSTNDVLTEVAEDAYADHPVK